MNIILAKIIAHRGASGYAPENTLASMQKAIALNATWVEFDVMLTKDQEAIILHDITLQRTTNGKGRVANKNWAEISALDAGTWFNEEFINQRIPTLNELLTYLKGLNCNINVEIKPTPGNDVATAEKTMAILQQYWPCELLPPLITSGKLACLEVVRKIDPNIPLGLVMHTFDKNWQAIADKLALYSFSIYHKILNPARVAAIKNSGRLVLAYTVNDIICAEKLFSWGVDAIFTDYPDILNANFNPGLTYPSQLAVGDKVSSG